MGLFWFYGEVYAVIFGGSSIFATVALLNVGYVCSVFIRLWMLDSLCSYGWHELW
jgi:hypothetical protein